ncbi:MAG: transcriptional repressor LexA, partial [Clostridiales bacterium]|nr:transcriptional repressor LexA [Clostridiales bacterium]
MLEPLSKKQEEVFNFLKNQIRKKGYPPTVREICDAVHLSSTSTVHAHLETLE